MTEGWPAALARRLGLATTSAASAVAGALAVALGYWAQFQPVWPHNPVPTHMPSLPSATESR